MGRKLLEFLLVVLSTAMGCGAGPQSSEETVAERPITDKPAVTLNPIIDDVLTWSVENSGSHEVVIPFLGMHAGQLQQYDQGTWQPILGHRGCLSVAFGDLVIPPKKKRAVGELPLKEALPLAPGIYRFGIPLTTQSASKCWTAYREFEIRPIQEAAAVVLIEYLTQENAASCPDWETAVQGIVIGASRYTVESLFHRVTLGFLNAYEIAQAISGYRGKAVLLSAALSGTTESALAAATVLLEQHASHLRCREISELVTKLSPAVLESSSPNPRIVHAIGNGAAHWPPELFDRLAEWVDAEDRQLRNAALESLLAAGALPRYKAQSRELLQHVKQLPPDRSKEIVWFVTMLDEQLSPSETKGEGEVVGKAFEPEPLGMSGGDAKFCAAWHSRISGVLDIAPFPLTRMVVGHQSVAEGGRPCKASVKTTD